MCHPSPNPVLTIVCIFLGVTASALRAAEPPVTALAFAPDGESVIAGSQAGLHVYSWPGLRRQRTLNLSMNSIHDLAFSPDGQMLAVGGGTPSEAGVAAILSWPDGKSMAVLDKHQDSVLAVAWKDDITLATASLDHDIVLWNRNIRQPTRRFQGHSKGVTTIQFLPDSNMLVSGGLDQNLRVWGITSGRQVRSLNNHTRAVHAVSVRPNSSPLPLVASVSSDSTVRLWQPTIGRMVRFVKLGSIPLAVSWLRDGSHLVVSCEDGNIRLIDPDTVEIVQSIPAVNSWAYSLAIHPTDGSVAIGGRHVQLIRIALEFQ